MDGKVKTIYPRKNWSSFMLFICAHPSTLTLMLGTINGATGAYLHRIQWGADSEIGDLPIELNGLQCGNERPVECLPTPVHDIHGAPRLRDWQDVDDADRWREQALAIDSAFMPR